MNLQDRAYAVGIFLILGICCIGAYVAVSGFMNANPSGLSLGLNATTPTRPATLEIPTGTVEIPTLTPPPLATAAAPTNTPRGFKPSPTPPSRGTPSPAFLADIPTDVPTVVGAAPSATSPAEIVGCGFPYCPKLKGPPSPDAPTGNICPLNYLWGFVLDSNGQGMTGMWIQYTNPDGNVDKTQTKAPPDPKGRYDVAAPGGVWALQVLDSSLHPVSPAVQIEAHIAYTSGNSCPTRLDFVKQ